MNLTSTDQLGHTFDFHSPAKRIVSLVPSQTEFLFDLGLENEIIGITKFCTHPIDKVSGVMKIGGTKNFHVDKIIELQPDLIIGNKEENVREGIVELQKYFPVWMSDIHTLNDAFSMMAEVARITDRSTEGTNLVEKIKDDFQLYQSAIEMKRVAYLIWQGPMMVAAGNTFIDHMLQQLGVENIFQNVSRYPQVTSEDIAALQPDYIFLSSEPYPFRHKHVEEFEAKFPSSKVMIVNGEMFSWYGSRLQYVPSYFSQLQNFLNT